MMSDWAAIRWREEEDRSISLTSSGISEIMLDNPTLYPIYNNPKSLGSIRRAGRVGLQDLEPFLDLRN